jgi:hypothetical protein
LSRFLTSTQDYVLGYSQPFLRDFNDLLLR